MILVTGATGFIGRALMPALRDARGLSRGDADLGKPVDWRPLLAGVDAVVHLAGQAHAKDALPDSHYDRINHVATAELAQACAAVGARLVFVSSIRAQTGPVAATTLTERDEPQPTDAYGRSKLAAEIAVRASGVAHTILRPVLVYGQELKGNLATLKKLASLPVPLPFGSFSNRRSLLSLDALVRAIQFSIAATTNETYVVADRAPIELRDIIGAFRKRRMLVPVPMGLMRPTLKLVRMWDRVGGELVVDPGKLIAAGWRPVDDTAAALRQL